MSTIPPPASWLVDHVHLICPGSAALDVACGSGRNAIFLASHGCRVQAIDRDAAKIEALQRHAWQTKLPVSTEVVDLERPEVDLGDVLYDVVVVVHYLHRPLMPALVRSLARGGLLYYETFTTLQAARGKPTNPDFLLRPGELPRLLAGLTILDSREGDFEGRMIASVVAQKP